MSGPTVTFSDAHDSIGSEFVSSDGILVVNEEEFTSAEGQLVTIKEEEHIKTDGASS